MLICEAAGFDVILVETVGIGQSETAVADMTDFFLVLMLPGAGDELQGIKKGVVELADMIAVNKADGDNIKRAKAAAGEYRAALHILTPRSPTWAPPVTTYSALTGDGIEALWTQVLAHRQQLSAVRRIRRAAARAAGQMDVVDAAGPLPLRADDQCQAEGAHAGDRAGGGGRHALAGARRRGDRRQRWGCDMTTILITGFGRFPGAPYNPSGPLARAVARRRRPAFADVRRIVHIFETSYAAVDRDLPKLLAAHKPDIVLMFGLAGRTPQRADRDPRAQHEIDPVSRRDRAPAGRTRDRAAARRPRAAAPRSPPARRRALEPRAAPACRAMPGATCAITVYWRALEASRSGTPLAQFIHIPPVARDPRRPGTKKRASRTPRLPAPARRFCSRFWPRSAV